MEWSDVYRLETEMRCPDMNSDPIAWLSYNKAARNPSIIEAIKRSVRGDFDHEAQRSSRQTSSRTIDGDEG